MNQILMVENKSGKKTNSTIDIKKIVLFFSIAIIAFGLILAIEGIVGLVKNNKGSEGKNPAIVGEKTPEPIDPIEEDLEEPTIELKVSSDRKNIIIIARDETEMDYVEYGWNNEETQIAEIADDKNRVDAKIELKSGTNTLKVIAVDKAGNQFVRQEDFEKRYPPRLEMYITEDQQGLLIKAACEDGIARIDFTQNGERYTLPIEDEDYTEEQFASMGAIVRYSDEGIITEVDFTYRGIVEGENRFSVYVYSTKGEVEGKDGTHTYTPQG